MGRQTSRAWRLGARYASGRIADALPTSRLFFGGEKLEFRTAGGHLYVMMLDLTDYPQFGHAHQGFTLGPVRGRLIAKMVTGQEPFIDTSPFRISRF
jgi:glycine/D-amino acid oxidase-like deaminating enzyme